MFSGVGKGLGGGGGTTSEGQGESGKRVGLGARREMVGCCRAVESVESGNLQGGGQQWDWSGRMSGSEGGSEDSQFLQKDLAVGRGREREKCVCVVGGGEDL